MVKFESFKEFLKSHLDSAPSNSPDRFSHEIDVNFRCVFLQLAEHLRDVALLGESDHDVQLLHLHVDRIVVFHEEYLNIVI